MGPARERRARAAADDRAAARAAGRRAAFCGEPLQPGDVQRPTGDSRHHPRHHRPQAHGGGTARIAGEMALAGGKRAGHDCYRRCRRRHPFHQPYFRRPQPRAGDRREHLSVRPEGVPRRSREGRAACFSNGRDRAFPNGRAGAGRTRDVVFRARRTDQQR